jgi:hypothetical protein
LAESFKIALFGAEAKKTDIFRLEKNLDVTTSYWEKFRNLVPTTLEESSNPLPPNLEPIASIELVL